MSLSVEDSPSDGPPSDPDPVPLYPEDVRFFFSKIQNNTRNSKRISLYLYNYYISIFENIFEFFQFLFLEILDRVIDRNSTTAAQYDDVAYRPSGYRFNLVFKTILLVVRKYLRSFKFCI